MESRKELKDGIIDYISVFRGEGNTYCFYRCGEVRETTIDDRNIKKYACIAVELSLAIRKMAYCGSFDNAAFVLLDEREGERKFHIIEFGKKYLGKQEMHNIVRRAANVTVKSEETYTRLLSAAPVRACAYDTAGIFLRERMECPLRQSIFDFGAEPPSKWDCALAMMLSLMAVDARLVER